MPVTGVLGSKLFITDAAIASTIDSEEEFFAQDWTEVSEIDTMPEFGRMFDTVTFQPVATGRTRKFKGGFNDGQADFTMGQDLADPGQAILQTGADAVGQDNYGFRIEFNDPPSSVGGPTTVFFRGLPMSYRTTMGATNAIVKATARAEVNSDIIYVPPADLYDRFITGGSLAAYALFNGSDSEAVDPVISANTLIAVTGNAGTGFAADGSQLIGSTGHTLSAGALVLEARVKLSAITNVGFFFGLTDQKVALEVPIESAESSDDLTTNATDAVGFLFDTAMTTDNIWLTGVNNNVDETAQDTTQAFAANTYATLRIELDTSGNVDFFMDGVQVGTTMTTACRTNVSLYPTLCASARSTASRTLTADYLYLRQD